MKSILKSACAVFILGVNSFAIANTTVNQSAISPELVTVKQALTQKDDTHVRLRGQVIKSLGDEKYQFRDTTGTIIVDIDDQLWQGKPVSDKTTIIISGEVDIDYLPIKSTEIDVNSIQF